jgi:N-methylhydantoinase B
LERDPDRVVRDIADANMTAEWARERTGVCLDERGALDREKTDDLRSKIVAQRLAVENERQTALESRPESEHDRAVSEGLALAGAGDDAVFVCRKCRTVIQRADKNYKSGCIKRTTDVQEVGLAPIDPKLFIDDEIVYREYFCPGCGLLFQGDFTRTADADIWDIRLLSTPGSAG